MKPDQPPAAPSGDLQRGPPGRVLSLEPRSGAVCEATLDAGDPLFAIHFPERPVLPGSFVLRIAFALAGRVEGVAAWRLRSLDRASFRAGAVPGAVLRVAVHRAAGEDGRYSFQAVSGGARIADGDFAIAGSAAP